VNAAAYDARSDQIIIIIIIIITLFLG